MQSNGVSALFNYLTRRYIRWGEEEIFGWTFEELNSMPKSQRKAMIHPEDYRMYSPNKKAYERSNKVSGMVIVYRVMGKDGEWHWVENRIEFTRDQGKLIGRSEFTRPTISNSAFVKPLFRG